MLPVIVCDDDSFTLHTISELLKRSIESCGQNARIACLTASGRELLGFIQKNPGTYLYFLDFDLGRQELNGIDLVRQIYQTDPQGKIVFVTSHTDKGMGILKSGIQALGFIEKSLDHEKMVREFSRYLTLASPRKEERGCRPSIEIPLGIDETVRLPIDDICYVDSVKTVAHSICYHTLDGSAVTVRDTMDHAQELLGDRFIRCHRSVLVNQSHVLSLENGMLRLSNGEAVSCAFGKRKLMAGYCIRRKEFSDGC